MLDTVPVNRKYQLFDATNILLMLVFTFFMIYPFINILAISLNDGLDAARGGIYFLPRKITLSNYTFLFQNADLWHGLMISVARVVVGTLTGVLATGLLAYLVTVKDFSGRKFMRILFIFTMYLSGGLIPVYLLMVRLHLIETFTVYWLPSLLNAYYMLLMGAYMQNLPDAIIDAARIDGCSELGIYVRIVMPMSMPVFASIAVFTGVGHWNSWFDVTLYNPSGHLDTLQVYLQKMLLQAQAVTTITDQETLYHKMLNVSPLTLRAATTMIVTIPIACIYPFFQKYFVGGITLGGVKE